jgi:calcineurin-like phosphoesterase family protein
VSVLDEFPPNRGFTVTVYFTSDTHFGHGSIIRLCKRPFASVDEMDEAIIERWNERVTPGDTVYHLGDFAFRNAAAPDTYFNRLNGTIHLVAGNHDRDTLRTSAGLFASVSLILEVKVQGQQIVLCHYPMREWHGSYRKAWHLFGHVHGRLNEKPLGYSLDVGVDSHEFRPWSMDEVGAVFAMRENPFIARGT